MAVLSLLGSAAPLGWERALAVVGAGLVAGLINGVAGGGTMVSFPVLLALGVPALTANITNTIGIWPGYLSTAAGLRTEIGSQRGRVRQLAPVSVVGGAVGATLLLTTPQSAFRQLVPWLVLLASALFAAQPWLSRRLSDPRSGAEGDGARRTLVLGGTLLTALYGGYFGAGMGVMLLAVLGLALPDTLVRTSGLRTALSIVVNGVGALVFVAAGSPEWSAVGLLALGSVVGGLLGAKVVSRVPGGVLRLLVVATGVATVVALLA